MEYFLLRPNGEQTGTFSIDQIRGMMKTGFIDLDTRYWHEGITEWRPIDTIEESLTFQPPAPAPSRTIPPQKLAAALRAVPPPGSKLEKSHYPPVQARMAPDQPAPPVIIFPPSQTDLPADPVITRAAEPAPTQIADAVRPRRKRLVGWVLYVLNVTVVALAIDYAVPVVHYVKDWLQTKVTLTENTYALTDRAMIKTFSGDMRNSPGADGLQHQMELTDNPDALMRLKIELDKVNTRHTDEVEQQYLGTGQAELIDPGTYRVLDYLDDNGDSTRPHAGKPVWLAILYKDQTVYAFKASNPPP